MRKNSGRGAKESGRQSSTIESRLEKNSKKSTRLPLTSRSQRRKDSIRSKWRRTLNGPPGKRRSRLSRPMKR